jgi:glycosyltransferase involved in cell wall biosynthesis
MRVAFLAHFFPPDGGAGAQRPASFARYLAGNGIEPIFFTRSVEESQRSLFDQQDDSLLPWTANARVERRPWSRETNAAWEDAVTLAVEAEHARQPFEVLAATCPPFALAPFAVRLAERIGVPALIDLRDPWALDGVRVFRHLPALKREQAVMHKALSASRVVVANTPESQRVIQRFLGPAGPEVACVTNGYEEEDFVEFECKVPGDGPLRLHFSGHFLADSLLGLKALKEAARILLGGRAEAIRSEGRGPGPLVGALERLQSEDAGLFGRLTVHVAGKQQAEVRKIVESSAVSEKFVFHGELPHDENLEFLRQADLLFLPLHGVAAGGRSRIVPGKAYEYLAARRPIVAALPEGDARDFVSRLGAGPVCDPCDRAAICEAIRRAAAWRFPDSTPPELAGFTRSALAARFADCLRRAAAV